MNTFSAYRQPTFYDNSMLMKYAPSVFAQTPWHNMSNKYQFVPTINIVEGMRKEGFEVVKAIQSRSRIAGKAEFTKHMLRFRMRDGKYNVGDTLPEVVLVNSHDGTSCYNLSAGMYRLVCANGMVVSQGSLGAYKTKHQGDIQGEVIDAAYSIVNDFPAITETVTKWKNTILPVEAQTAYAESASLLRWDAEEEKPDASRLLAVRRYEDKPEVNTLWGTFQRVQEAMIRGGNLYRHKDKDGYTQVRRTRAVKGIDQDVKLNKALWALTEKMEALIKA